MRRFKLECDLWVPAPLDRVWEFASSPQNLVKISPSSYGVKVSNDARTENGARFTIEVSPLGLPVTLKWRSLIQDVMSEGPKRQFVDVQEAGPFSMWRHTHSFEAGSSEIEGQRSGSRVKMHEPGTWLRDRVEYALPWGFLGEAGHAIYLRRSLASMFAHRLSQLREIFDPSSSR